MAASLSVPYPNWLFADIRTSYLSGFGFVIYLLGMFSLPSSFWFMVSGTFVICSLFVIDLLGISSLRSSFRFMDLGTGFERQGPSACQQLDATQWAEKELSPPRTGCSLISLPRTCFPVYVLHIMYFV